MLLSLALMKTDLLFLQFDVKLLNQQDANYISWCWDGGDVDPATNNDGTIQSTLKLVIISQLFPTQVQASDGTVGHGLGKPPKFIITKRRDSITIGTSITKVLGNDRYLNLNLSAASSANGALWNNTSPTNDVFHLVADNGANSNGSKIIAYCFAEGDDTKIRQYAANYSSNRQLTVDLLLNLF